jgi:hypothetical protein
LDERGGDEEYASFPQNYRFQVPGGSRWSDIRAVTSNVGMALQKAMRGIGKANLEAGNILFKQLQYLAGALAVGVVVEAKVPIVLTSRADGELARMASWALGVLLAKPEPNLT